MTEFEIRLECLRLANALIGRGSTEVIATAKIYEEFVSGQADPAPAQANELTATAASRGAGRGRKEKPGVNPLE